MMQRDLGKMEHSRSGWRDAICEERCPICGKGSWCRLSRDGMLALCRRVEVGALCTKSDRNGEPFYLHRVRDEPLVFQAAPASLRPGIERASDPVLNTVYRAILERLTLHRHHREALRTRGLSHTQITEAGYRTLPDRPRWDIVQDLPERFFSVNLLTVPGLILGMNGRLTIAGCPGVLIPVRDTAQQIVALRIRLDNPKHGSGKYHWLSSRHKGGPSPEPHAHCPIWHQETELEVRLTEGELKADVATVLSDIVTVSVPGVGLWRVGIPLIRSLGGVDVRLAYDADFRTNPTVRRALVDAFDGLRQAGFRVRIEVWEDQL